MHDSVVVNLDIDEVDGTKDPRSLAYCCHWCSETIVSPILSLICAIVTSLRLVSADLVTVSVIVIVVSNDVAVVVVVVAMV